ncbi:hypothetical protein [Puniceibacterium sediminis]|uniref:hypothetical protein n=1 Tax=Puniceibacterium sediminis TaxID=1608407 RepID=UPI0011316B0D|nr:hypothetical protein [Puniceibacterium sediminis]
MTITFSGWLVGGGSVASKTDAGRGEIGNLGFGKARPGTILACTSNLKRVHFSVVRNCAR